MRILQIGMTDNLGGIETFLINYYRNIDTDNCHYIVSYSHYLY